MHPAVVWWDRQQKVNREESRDRGEKQLNTGGASSHQQNLGISVTAHFTMGLGYDLSMNESFLYWVDNIIECLLVCLFFFVFLFVFFKTSFDGTGNKESRIIFVTTYLDFFSQISTTSTLRFGQISPLVFFRWLTATSDWNAESCNRIPSNYCLP